MKPKSIQECKEIVAKKYGLGSTLVMGHKASYWEEAMTLYAEQKEKEELKVPSEKDIENIERVRDYLGCEGQGPYAKLLCTVMNDLLKRLNPTKTR